MSMKLLLLAPPICDYYFTPQRAQPLGLFYLKSAILNYFPDFQVDIYDARLSRKRKKLPSPPEFSHLRDLYLPDKSSFGLFSNYQRFGDSTAKIVDRIITGAYDIVGISSLFSAYHPDVELIAAAIKQQTTALVVMGGWAIKAEANRLALSTHADYLVTGDEENLLWLLEQLKSGERRAAILKVIPSHLVPRECQQPANFFMTEFPQREGTYHRGGARIATMTLSRGCALRCNFCAIHRLQQQAYKPLELIDKELAYLAGIGTQIIDFEDDHLFDARRDPANFLSLLQHYHAKGLSYMAMNGITAPYLLPFTQQALDAGFLEFNLSLVSSQRHVAQEIARPNFLEAIDKIARLSCGRAHVVVYLILGLAHQSVKDALADILTLAALPVTVGASPLYMLPGVPMFEEMGLPKERRLMRGSALHRFLGKFEREDVLTLWKIVRMINAIKMDAAPDEHIYYFKKSLRERRWYRFDGERWLIAYNLPSLSLPNTIDICNHRGEMKHLTLPT